MLDRLLSKFAQLAAALPACIRTAASGSCLTPRDWAGDKTDAPREMAEMCLARVVGGDVERA